MMTKCSNCGSGLNAEEKFCGDCGSAIAHEERDVETAVESGHGNRPSAEGRTFHLTTFAIFAFTFFSLTNHLAMMIFVHDWTWVSVSAIQMG